MVILPVDVVGNGTTDRYPLRPRNNGQMPSTGDDGLVHLGNRAARLYDQCAKLLIELQDAMVLGHGNQRCPIVQAHITVRPTGTVRQVRSIFWEHSTKGYEGGCRGLR